MTKQCVIFDLDGVISDTQVLHSTAETRILAAYGVNVDTTELSRRYAGIPEEILFRDMLSDNPKKDIDIAAVIAEKWEILNSMLEGGIKEIPHATVLIKTLHKAGFPLAVASGSPVPFIKQVLSTLGVESLFTALISARDVPKGKPAPDVFLEAAKRLGTSPRDSVVIEDGLAGMMGAIAAGMKCIALVPSMDRECPAHLRVTSLGELSVEIVHKVLS